MPRVNFVKKARKPIPGAGVEVGDSYYWWMFNFSKVKHCSKTPPKPSQLTQSEYLSTAYDLQEQAEAINVDGADSNSAAEDLRSIADELRSLGEEQSSKRDNMPESLQDSDTGQKLEARAEACDEIAGEIESAADEIEGMFDDQKEDTIAQGKTHLEELRTLVTGAKLNQRLTAQAKKHLTIEWQEDADELQECLEGIAENLHGFEELLRTYHRTLLDKQDDYDGSVQTLAEKVNEKAAWFQEAWQLLLDAVQEEVQNKIGEISWEVDPY